MESNKQYKNHGDCVIDHHFNAYIPSQRISSRGAKMKLFMFGLGLLATTAFAQFSPSGEYLPPNAEAGALLPSGEYLAPAGGEEHTILADDGYRYRAVHRLRSRKRRDVSELPSSEYLPPQQHEIAFAPSNEYLAPAGGEEQTVLADDGYRYRAVRRLRSRKRRDVSELLSADYLPPQQEEAFAPAEEETVLADDGYRYKAVHRLRSRRRRDVSELLSADYLPPQQEIAFAPAEEEQTILADDGYRYKAVHRLRNRRRRDVSELAAGEYLPPQQEIALAPSNEYLAPAAEEQTLLADDGYRYKTVHRLRNRRRRDVSELPSGEYLPPQQHEIHQEVSFVPSNEYLAPAGLGHHVEQQATILADDGYRYKVVRRLRHRRH